ncbi:MAG: serine/threonine protein kinase [Candidatus Dadabacteria bacterium]|nr:MAG: serine/threonine protein kinase [Candidatus Dadabacteria bacterium]
MPIVDSFDFSSGTVLARKYEIIEPLGAGWEGEVYKIKEIKTGIERAAKFFFPHRNKGNKTSCWYAKKLHKLRHCPILIKYHTQETINYHGFPVTFLVSEYVEGELLSHFLKRQPGKRIPPFQAMHLLYYLAAGIESIHLMKEYHGDLHADNVIVRRYGLGFDLKLVDMFHWGSAKQENIYDDVCDLVKLFYDAIGGKKVYAKQRKEVKEICCGLKRSLIIKKFRSAGQLREYLETMEWD